MSKINGIIIDGISGSGKSTIIKAFMKNYSQSLLDKSFVYISEHHTQRVLEEKERQGILKKSDHTKLLGTHLNYFEGLHSNLKQANWCDENMTGDKLNILIERFHLTHLFYYNYLNWPLLEQIDSRLADIGFKLCVLTYSGKKIRERLVESREENKSWMNYLKRYGRNNAEIIDHFKRQSDTLISGFRKSKMEKFIIDTSSISVEEAVSEFSAHSGLI